MDQEKVESALLDIRKAYRMLYLYQKRILDLANYVGNYYGFTYSGGWPMFSDASPRKGKGHLDNWAWDWLNMYFYQFHFTIETEHDIIKQFAIFHQADTGYFDASQNAEYSDRSKKEVESFNTVQNSKSMITLVYGHDKWDDGKTWYKSDVIKSEIKEGKLGSGNNLLLFKKYEVSSFFSESSTLENLRTFSAYCNAHGIQLEQKYQNVENKDD